MAHGQLTETWPDADVTRNWRIAGGTLPYTLSAVPGRLTVQFTTSFAELALVPKTPDDPYNSTPWAVGDGLLFSFYPDIATTEMNALQVSLSDATISVEYGTAYQLVRGDFGASGSLPWDPTKSFYSVIWTGSAVVFSRSPDGLGSWEMISTKTVSAPQGYLTLFIYTDGGAHADAPQLGPVIYGYEYSNVAVPVTRLATAQWNIARLNLVGVPGDTRIRFSPVT